MLHKNLHLLSCCYFAVFTVRFEKIILKQLKMMLLQCIMLIYIVYLKCIKVIANISGKPLGIRFISMLYSYLTYAFRAFEPIASICHTIMKGVK